MLTIQRASAGSGKTYTLAKQFILNIIAYKDEKGIWRLRNSHQMEDALNHILAITFTNKATNEMKERIVTNLSLLSKAAQIDQDGKLDSNIPYLHDFHYLLNAEYSEIGKTCEAALKVILNNYSRFKISTIDSFFQEILRTFTYEANITDSYQLELDSSFIVDSALEAAIFQLDSNPEKMGAATFWLKTIMKEVARKSQRWNPFNRKNTTGSVYYKITNALMQLEREEFKDIKDSLYEYFSDPQKINHLPEVYKNFKQKAAEERDVLLKEMVKAAVDAEALILKDNISSSKLNSNFINQLGIIKNLKLNQSITFKYTKIFNDRSVFLKPHRTPDHPLDRIALRMYELVEQWKNPAPDSYYKTWTVYGDLIPYLGLILEIRAFISQVLDTTNTIQLSDTGFILKKIIGEDDAPFVYERLGNRIDNYLIDEFQDTSRMQWDIIYPLINEALSKNKESLIIGDPKQSIYRFRNADYKLISNVVPQTFPFHKQAGFSVEENTNWRSNTKIVEFNNFFFKTLASAVADLSLTEGGNIDFNNLYANVVQRPHNKKGQGYVEIRSFDSPENNESNDNFNEEDSKDWFEVQALSNLTSLISSLLKRGYRQKDICILVSKNQQAKDVVETLINYNDSLPKEEMKIDFISEESLLVSSSLAVKIILDVLEILGKPAKVSVDNNEVEKKSKYINWNSIKVNYSIYANQHSELSHTERIISFLNSHETDKILPSLLKELPTPSLASLVEQIIKSFLDENLRKSQALYLASFQDIVNEYAATHVNDPSSFLEWWKVKGKNISISTPEGINAVQIMTVHKSKGLEFKCVILPFATDSFKPSNFKEEWRWVKPVDLPNLDLPPVIPIKTSSKLKGSIHQNIYSEYFDQVITDKLNMYYVAFTRAVNELYVFTKNESGKKPTSTPHFLNQILKGKLKYECFSEDEMDYIMNLDSKDVNIEETIFTFGMPFTSSQIKEDYIKDEEKAKKGGVVTTKFFKQYYINDKRPKMRSIAAKVTPSGEFLS